MPALNFVVTLVEFNLAVNVSKVVYSLTKDNSWNTRTNKWTQQDLN